MLTPLLAARPVARFTAPSMQANEPGMRMRPLGSSGIMVSEMGLGTQRWGGTDFNSPDEKMCHAMLDLAVEAGVNLVDTAEQYPIPSGRQNPEGLTEKIIGSWMAKAPERREQLVIASKITGGVNVTPENLEADLRGTLKRLGTDYLDVYLLHWPARYTPQANWGQSLSYSHIQGEFGRAGASFEQIAETMGKFVKEGRIRGWGMCNDNCYGLMGSTMAAKQLGVDGPCVMQNDYSLINRRIEENGLSEASAPWNENVGFMGYNTLAGGVLTGKYLDVPAAADDPNKVRAFGSSMKPRGRHDEQGWGRTLYRYRSGPATEATQEYAQIAERAGMSLTELSLRWCRSRQACTSVLLGHTSIAQLVETLDYFSAPPLVEYDNGHQEFLPEEVLWDIDRVHMMNRLPIFSSTRVAKEWEGQGEIGELIP